MILITGAAGKTGTAITKQLTASNHEIRCLIFRENQKESLMDIGVNEFVIGDMRNKKVVKKALCGIKAVYHICPNVNPDELQIGILIIEEALSARVEHFVYHSVLLPQISAMPHHWNKLLVEEF